ncbi:hypothetical protein G6L12_08325 [Agrobacterium rhizogenes]|nr:hypothetical protein [Rhizobium rhizogenes]NTF74479.1 hypothetical protein [Rhizobium rhizogenes]
MTIDDQIIRAYLQAAHNRGGSFHMAMLMMVQRMFVLEDRLLRAGVAFEEDKAVREFMGNEVPK